MSIRSVCSATLAPSTAPPARGYPTNSEINQVQQLLLGIIL